MGARSGRWRDGDEPCLGLKDQRRVDPHPDAVGIGSHEVLPEFSTLAFDRQVDLAELGVTCRRPVDQHDVQFMMCASVGTKIPGKQDILTLNVDKQSKSSARRQPRRRFN